MPSLVYSFSIFNQLLQCLDMFQLCICICYSTKYYAVLTHLSPTSEVGGSNPRLLFGKVGSCLPMVGTVQNLDQLYALVSSARKTTSRDMTCTVLKAT